MSQAKSLTLVDVISAAIVIAAIVMLPAGLFGWLKLRRRNLALLLEGSGWALNDRLKLTPGAGRARHPQAAAAQGRPPSIARTALRSTASGVRGEEEEDEEGMPAGMKLLVALAILAALLWQVRGPLVRGACGRQWLAPDTCGALLPSDPVPPAPPAPAIPAAPAPATPPQP